MTWVEVTPAPREAAERVGKVVRWHDLDPIMVNLDLVAIIQPASFLSPGGTMDGSKLIWHGSMPRTEWVVYETPDIILKEVNTP